MRKNLKAIAQAAQAQQNPTNSALFMQAAPVNQPAEAPAPEVAAEAAAPAEATPADEAPEASPLAIVRDEAPEDKPLFVPTFTTTPAPVAVPTPAAVVAPAPAPAPRSLDDLLNLVNEARSVTDRLTIKDGGGLEWSTTKSSIIRKVLELLRTDLSTAIETAESELRGLLPAA